MFEQRKFDKLNKLADETSDMKLFEKYIFQINELYKTGKVKFKDKG